MKLPGISMLAATLALSLSACAITAPTGSESPTAAPSSTSAAATPTPSQTETVGLELRGDGVGSYAFGAAQEDVTAALEAELGQPDDTFQGPVCDLDTGSPWMEGLQWGKLWIRFTAKTASKKAPRTLTSWGMSLPNELPGDLQLQDGVPVDLSFAELKAQYSEGKLQTVAPFNEDVVLFTLPSGIEFSGRKKPESVNSGELQSCE